MTLKFNPITQKLDVVVSDAYETIKNALNNKADIVHTHLASEIVDLNTAITNHPDVSGNTTLAHTRNQDEQLRGGLVEVDANGNTQISGELGFKVFIQATEPVILGNGRIAMWQQTTTGLTFLIYKNSLGSQKLVELS